MIDPVVDASWIADRPVVLADVRWYLDGRSGREAYERGHLPGAVFIDLDAALAGPASPAEGRHPLPDPEVFAAAMAAAGIQNRSDHRVRRRGRSGGREAGLVAPGDGA